MAQLYTKYQYLITWLMIKLVITELRTLPDIPYWCRRKGHREFQYSNPCDLTLFQRNVSVKPQYYVVDNPSLERYFYEIEFPSSTQWTWKF